VLLHWQGEENYSAYRFMKITPLIASSFLSDGGAMFGLVPKPVWSKLVQADESNRILQHTNALLVQHDGKHILVGTGCGDPAGYSEKELRFNGLGERTITASLKQVGVAPEEIDIVIFSHLHWDHVGGALDAHGKAVFPNALHYMDMYEAQDAISREELLHKTYPSDKVEQLFNQVNVKRCLHHKQQLSSLVYPGIRLVFTGGHSRGHCMVLIEHKDGLEIKDGPNGLKRIAYVADVMPTRHHLPLVYQTSYDQFPLDSRRWKMNWLSKLAREDTLIFLCHDPEIWGGRVVENEQGWSWVDRWQKADA